MLDPPKMDVDKMEFLLVFVEMAESERIRMGDGWATKTYIGKTIGQCGGSPAKTQVKQRMG